MGRLNGRPEKMIEVWGWNSISMIKWQAGRNDELRKGVVIGTLDRAEPQ